MDCNAVGEDRHVEDFLSRDILSVEKVASLNNDRDFSQFLNADSSLKIFSVIDGHAGTDMADTLTQKLHPAMISSIRCSVAGGKPRYTDPMSAMRKCSEGALTFLSGYKHFECSGLNATPCQAKYLNSEYSRNVISDALSAAWTNLDYEICVRPLRDMLEGHWNDEKVQFKDGPADAVSGACAVTVLVDEESQDVYVAHAGDSRAVAGYWVPPRTLPSGVRCEGGWRCEVLTADHNAKNSSEVERCACVLHGKLVKYSPYAFRLASEHPGEKNVLDPKTGRVLGALMPTRAFGEFPFSLASSTRLIYTFYS